MAPQHQICPLCGQIAHYFYTKHAIQRHYFQCSTCQSISVNPESFLSPKEELKRYKLHENTMSDLGYVEFLTPLRDWITEDHSQGRGLDYGAGEGAVLAKMLQEKGLIVDVFDPYFFPELPQSSSPKSSEGYDFVVCSETAEHFYHPELEFRKLFSLLKTKGHLYLQTDFWKNQTDFGDWYYKNDPTHVIFYREETLKWMEHRFHCHNLTFRRRIARFQKGISFPLPFE